VEDATLVKRIAAIAAAITLAFDGASMAVTCVVAVLTALN
jgi:hypothetical protein